MGFQFHHIVRFIIAFAFTLSGMASANAQEWLGSAFDNYTPSNAMLINPSAIVDQKPWLDIHLIGVGAHGTNNLAYLANSRVLSFQSYGTPGVNLDQRNGWAQLNAQAMGPSASISLGKHAFGFHTRVRAAGNLHRFPAEYMQILLEGNPVDSGVFQVNNMRAKTLTWGEVGLTYGRILYQFDKHFLTGGITVNRLIGLQAASLFIDEGTMLVENSRGELLSGNGKYAYAQPAFTMGGGWSTSLGITYKRMIDDVTSYVPHGRNVDCHTLPYKWKLSGSVTDLGGVRVKRGGLYNRFDDSENPDTYLNSVASGVDPNSVPRDGDRYTAWLPVGFNGQFDYNFENGLFLNAFVMQRLSFPSSYGPDRSNLIAVSPRYERKWLMVTMPFSLENYRDPHLGLAVRLWILTVGTEHILPYLFRSDVYTADAYVNLRLRLYKAPGCRTKPRKGIDEFKFGDLFKRGEKDPAACPDW